MFTSCSIHPMKLCQMRRSSLTSVTVISLSRNSCALLHQLTQQHAASAQPASEKQKRNEKEARCVNKSWNELKHPHTLLKTRSWVVFSCISGQRRLWSRMAELQLGATLQVFSLKHKLSHQSTTQQPGHRLQTRPKRCRTSGSRELTFETVIWGGRGASAGGGGGFPWSGSREVQQRRWWWWSCRAETSRVITPGVVAWWSFRSHDARLDLESPPLHRTHTHK